MIRLVTTFYWFLMAMAEGASPEVPSFWWRSPVVKKQRDGSKNISSMCFLVLSDPISIAYVQETLFAENWWKLQKQHLSACVFFQVLLHVQEKNIYSLSQSKVYVCFIMLVIYVLKRLKRHDSPLDVPSIPSPCVILGGPGVLGITFPDAFCIC